MKRSAITGFAYLCMSIATLSVGGCAQDGATTGPVVDAAPVPAVSAVPAVPAGGISPMSPDAVRGAEMAPDYRNGLFALNCNSDPVRGVMLLQRAAAAGNPAAQTYLGSLYEHGKGVPVDRAAAMDLFHQAALRGYAPAEFDLAAAYRTETELGVFTGDQRALDWLRLSAAQQDDLAEIILAASYLDPDGAAYDPAKARDLVASARGHMVNPFAAYLLSLIYDHGMLGARDSVQALHWLQWAADHRNPSAEINLGKLYAEGHDLAQDTIQAAYWHNRGVADAAGHDGSADLQPPVLQ